MRLYKYDFVRAVAILFVVAVHSLYFVDQSNPACLWIYWTLLTLFLTGNALFFLMSGKFNLRERPNDAGVKKILLQQNQKYHAPNYNSISHQGFL